MAKQGVELMAGNSIKKRLDRMVAAGRSRDALIHRDIFRIYQNAQLKRFQSVNNKGGTTSEGDHWASLSPVYAKYKPRKYAKYMGEGTRMLVATGTLARVVTGMSITRKNPESGETVTMAKMFGPGKVEVRILGEYPRDVNDTRPFMKFGDKTWATIRARIKKFIGDGK